MKDRNHILEEDLANTVKELNEFQQSFQKVSREAHEASKNASEFEDQLKEANRKLTEWKKKYENVKTDLDKERKERRSSITHVTNIETKALHERQSATVTLDMLESLLADEKERTKSLSDTIHSLRLEITAKDDLITSMKAEGDDSSSSKQMWKRHMDELVDTKRVIESERDDATKLLHAATEQLEQQFQKMNELNGILIFDNRFNSKK